MFVDVGRLRRGILITFGSLRDRADVAGRTLLAPEVRAEVSVQLLLAEALLPAEEAAEELVGLHRRRRRRRRRRQRRNRRLRPCFLHFFFYHGLLIHFRLEDRHKEQSR